jgi:hypothetical protein
MLLVSYFRNKSGCTILYVIYIYMCVCVCVYPTRYTWADDLAIAHSTSYEKIELVDKDCKNLNFKCDLNNSKVMILTKGAN